MNLYLISQSENYGYDTFDSAVVCAPNAETAQSIHPHPDREAWDDSWCAPEFVRVQYLGPASPHLAPGVVLSSFNAG